MKVNNFKKKGLRARIFAYFYKNKYFCKMNGTKNFRREIDN